MRTKELIKTITIDLSPPKVRSRRAVFIDDVQEVQEQPVINVNTPVITDIKIDNRKLPKTPEQRKALSDKMKGRKFTPEHIANMKGNNLGKKHTAETKEKMSLAARGKTHVVSDEVKNILQEKATGRLHTEEAKAKMSEIYWKRHAK